MRRLPSWALILGFLALAGVVGIGVGWLATRSSESDGASKVVAEVQDQPKTVIPKTSIATNSVAKHASKSGDDTAAENTVTATVPTAGDDQWHQALEDVLVSEGEPEQKADRLLNMMPHLNAEAQVEVSQHLVNFVMDDHYEKVAQIVTNAATPEAVSSVFLTDLLNRNDGLKLPLLLSVAKNQEHPKHEEAQNLLELFIQENYGTDWNKWDQAVTNWLAQNGAIEAPLESAPEPAPATGDQP
jgi:hypothetical protein